MTLYLARHGRSEGQGLFLGQSDPALSEEGRRQSEALATELGRAGVERIVCSMLKRSWQTAEVVAQRLRLRVERDERLNELAYGRWDGLAWEEIELRWPDEARRKLADWWGVTPDGGEEQAAFLQRVAEAWDDIRSRRRTTLLVGHAGVNGLLAELARGHGEPDWQRVTAFEQGYGEALRIEIS